MWDKKISFKLTTLAVLASSLCSCAIADEPNGLMSIFKQSVESATPTAVTSTSSTEGTEQPTDPLLIQQMELEKQAEAQRLEQERKAAEERAAREKQLQAESKLQETTGSAALQLKSAVAKLYADNQYALLWNDKEAEKQFLREYAAVVMSGVSKKSATILSQIDKVDPNNTLLRDILLTDAFLDYMYYSKNVSHAAQKWLYSADSYTPSAPNQSDINAWVEAAKNGNALSYINNLSSHNKLYKQTISYIKAMPQKSKGKKSSAEQVYKLAINAQRLRVIPNFENGLFVNIPSYQLQYYRDGKLTLTSRVIVGKDERKTPVMYSKLSNVVVNPPWNTPTRLANEDILPKIRKDPRYIERNGYELIDSKGNIVNPAGINWAGVTKFPYRLRQKPSDNSALGRYKFNMPSSDAIYLHDTPSRGLFAQQNRALSSGCIRVEKSDQLATILLKEAGWSEDKKQSVLNSRKTTSAPIKSNNPVYLYYVTAWIDNNKIQTLPDIYSYDKTPDLSYINWSTVYKYL